MENTENIKITEPQDEFLTDENKETHIEENYFFKNEEWKIMIKTRVIPKPQEPQEQKFARVFEKLKSSTNLTAEDLEGVVFDDKQIGDLILERVFDGNPHAEIALQAKVLSMMVTGQLDAEKMKQMYKVQEEINEIREFFGLKRI